MSVAVYLRTRGLSASARSPVPALFPGSEGELNYDESADGEGLRANAPEFENVRLTELCIVEQTTSARLWKVQLS
jgi:hypothetical protein